MNIKQLAVFMWLLTSVCMLTALPTEPLLRINTGMHTGWITSMSIDDNERNLLTCSMDKTARLWDLKTGELTQVFRVPSDTGNTGMLYACALSPDGRYAVMGGYTADFDIYIFNTASGSIVKSIKQLPGLVYDLKFSPNGAYLAVGLGGSNGVIIYNSSDWSERARLDGYNGNTNDIDFSLKGDFATVSEDDALRLYDNDFKLINKYDFSNWAHPFSVSLSPDGKLIVVGFLNLGQPAVLDTRDFREILKPKNTDDTNDSITKTCFSKNGKSIIAGYSFFQKDEVTGATSDACQIHIWQTADLKSYTNMPSALNSIYDIVTLADGGYILCGTNNDWVHYSPSGEIITYNHPKLQDPDDIIGCQIQVSPTGNKINVTLKNSQTKFFNVTDRYLTSVKGDLSEISDSVETSTDENGNSEPPVLTDQEIQMLEQGEWIVSSIAVANKVLVGTSWDIYCFDNKRKLIWKSSTQTAVKALQGSGNGSVAVSVMDDGTLRWYRMSDGTLLMSLYVHNDGEHWILYTPGGYYDCAPGSENLIGWHLNQGADKEALFYPVGRFRSTYYRPDVIDRILTTLDEAEAVKEANLAAGITDVAKGVENILPPTVRITSPASNSPFTSSEVMLNYSFTSPNNEPVTAIKVLIDGRPNISLNILSVGSKSMAVLVEPDDRDSTVVVSDIKFNTETGSVKVTLPPRNVRVGIIAENRFGSSEPDEINLVWKGEILKSLDFEQPNLYALIIGISQYKTEGYKLKYPAKDARDFAASLQAQQGMMYDSVNTRLLTDDDATRDAILDGLDWLQKSCTAGDVAVIFLSGHGVNDNVGLFYYLPVGANIARLKATCIPFSDFENTIGSIPGKVIVFADACHSGGIYTDTSVKAPDLTRMINEITDAEVGAIIFTSCTPRQLSFENDVWKNGAFTKALVEGMNGEADFRHKKRITVKALDLYVSDRVRELTEEKQTPTTIVPQSIPDFDIGLVP
jgi:hypothetical protein